MPDSNNKTESRTESTSRRNSSASAEKPATEQLKASPATPNHPTPAPADVPGAPGTPDGLHRINLALQGGGSHGAFTWGVLDALLEDGSLQFEGLSGTSAGAMNAVVLASGFAQAHALAIADPKEAHAKGCELARQQLRFFWESVGAMGSFMSVSPANYALNLMPWFKPMLAPAQLNPLSINPLRSLLKRTVDFEQLVKLARHEDVPQVFVCATNVRTGRGEIFSGKNLSLDSVMASACLPQLFQPVEIKGEFYWDGGFSGNPAIHPLIYDTRSGDVLLVQINPIETQTMPSTMSEIQERVNEVTFNASLLSELRAIHFVQRLLDEGRLERDRYKYMRMHRIDGGSYMQEFGSDTKLRADMVFLLNLFGKGREAAGQWLRKNRKHIGVRPTLK